MKMICDVPDEVIKSVRMGTWCGSSVMEEMIANGTPLSEVLKNIKAELEPYKYEDKYKCCTTDCTGWICVVDVLNIIDKHMEKRG